MFKAIYYALVAILVGCLIGMFVTAWVNTDKAIAADREEHLIRYLEVRG